MDIEAREREMLAPYAMKSSESTGRVHKEEEHLYRAKYQRDKDRIVYSTAFRRLEYKTQVFVNHEGDYYRTRLTHTLEVAQIARTLARALGLNEDLVEAIALAHDLGHTPFGHSGEETLSNLMKDHGGFDHNTHGLRVVDVLEEKYPDFPGLNLTNEVRRGIIRHSTPFDLVRMDSTDIPGPWLLEIQLVDISDEIAYDNHDLDDGLKSGLVNEEDIESVPVFREASSYIDARFKKLNPEARRYQIIRHLINTETTDVIENSLKKIESLCIRSVSDIPSGDRTICSSEEMRAKRLAMREVLMDKLYRHFRVVRMSNKASRFLRSLFMIYCDNPEQLAPDSLKKVEERGKHRAICDYIAGMTDRYALDQYKRFFEPYERV
jgi:dGTPase